MAQGTVAPTRTGGLQARLPWIGIGISAWAMIPPYVGPELANLKSSVEIADHVVPAVVMLVMAVACLALGRRSDKPSSFPLVSGFTFALAGLWMTATHLPLVQQARRGEAGVTDVAAAWHTTPGIVVLVFGLVWVAGTWGDTDEPEPTKGSFE